MLEIDPTCRVERGKKSVEAANEKKRLMSVLEAVYLKAIHIPDSPAEPKPEPDYDDSKTIVIPWEQPKTVTVFLPLAL